jgi:ABC-type nitrate/sulfonate/bicarbonate transport system substrate-binding protein
LAGPWAAQGAGRNPYGLLLAHAAWIEAEIPQKSRRLFEELERIARFFAQRAKNAP